MIRTLCVAFVCLWCLEALVHAQPEPTTHYSAFDIAGETFAVQLSPGARLSSMFHNNGCVVQVDNDRATIGRSKTSPSCEFIFSQMKPTTLQLELDVNGTRQYQTLTFDFGINGIVSATYDPDNQKLVFADSLAHGKVAYFSKTTQSWAESDVQMGKPFAQLLTVDVGLVTSADVFYFRPAGHSEVYIIDWTLKAPKPERLPTASDCMQDASKLSYDWAIYFDAANAAHALGVLSPAAPADPAAPAAPVTPELVVLGRSSSTTAPSGLSSVVVAPNTVGVIVVRHWDTDMALIDGTGPVALTQPAIKDGASQAALEKPAPAPAPAAGPPWPKASVCEFKPVSPHAPGAFTVAVKIADGKDASKVLSARTIDLVTEQRYSGAFRVGVAGVLFANDQKFAAETFPNSMQPEIVRTEKTPVELVVGYAQFFNDGGRWYGPTAHDEGWDMIVNHLGAYFGVGLLSLSGTSVDFLKSLHVGLEYELSSNVSIAVTGVLRRVDELADDARVGAPAPSSIPLQSEYRPGVAVILNINPSFFRFPLSLAK